MSDLVVQQISKSHASCLLGIAHCSKLGLLARFAALGACKQLPDRSCSSVQDMFRVYAYKAEEECSTIAHKQHPQRQNMNWPVKCRRAYALTNRLCIGSNETHQGYLWVNAHLVSFKSEKLTRRLAPNKKYEYTIRSKRKKLRIQKPTRLYLFLRIKRPGGGPGGRHAPVTLVSAL